jgi:riboflavin kinase/FMN adenylyltransferase
MMEYQTTLADGTPIAITIGNFDGIHLGHQRLLYELREQARRLACTPVLVTFSPHTLLVVRPTLDLRYLTTLDEKLVLASQYGKIADNIVISFTPEVAAMSAEDFMDQLRQRFSLRGIVVGADFSLGRNRAGNIAFLEEYGRQHQIEVQPVSLREAEQQRISSTRIRTLLSEGQVSEANALLGHPTLVSGIVKHGDERGRQIGFPTANLHHDPRKLLPADGVYAARVYIQNTQTRDSWTTSTVYNGVVNIGVRPTFNGKERLVEAHLLDVNLDLYEQHLVIEFIERLRGEQRFSGIDALKAQIAVDVQKAHHILTVRRVSH